MLRTICKLNSADMYVEHRVIEDWEGVPAGWLLRDPPEITPAKWEGQWVEAEFEEETTPQPVLKCLVSKSLWLGQLNFPEKMKLAELEARVGAINWDAPPADAFALKLRYFAAFVSQFGKLGDYIDLADQDVLEGLELFRDLMGMSLERMDELLDYDL
jgi:hypothetical protein